VLESLLFVVQVVAMIAFWFVVIIVIPAAAALYVPLLFPLTGQWRKRWTERHQKRRDTGGNTYVD
jgi:hypothetical protein